MSSRKTYALAAVAVTALGGAGLLIAMAQDARGSAVQVLLRPGRGTIHTATQTSCRLTVPRRFFARGMPLSEISSEGVERLVLEIEAADLQGALGGTAPDLDGAPLHMELAAPDTFLEGLGERRRDEAMNQAPDSRRRMSVPPPGAPGDVTEYVFHNISPRAMAYYFKGLDGGVFVDCSEQARCRGFQSWRGVLDVEYEYQRAALNDPRPMSEAVRRLLESFKPASAPAAKQPNRAAPERPVFEPSTRNSGTN
jgi:hypothetical protein